MVSVPVQCPHCHSMKVIKAGKQANGAQRYPCQTAQCGRRIFLLQYQDRGRAPEVRCQVVDLALNGSGMRDTARVLRISPDRDRDIKNKPPFSDTPTPRCSLLLVHAPTPSASGHSAPPKWRKWGVASGPK